MNTPLKAKICAYSALFSIFCNIFSPFAGVLTSKTYAQELTQETNITLNSGTNSIVIDLPTKDPVNYLFAYQTVSGQTEVVQGTSQAADTQFHREFTVGTCSSAECVLQTIERGIFKYQTGESQAEAILFTSDKTTSKITLTQKTSAQNIDLSELDMAWLQKGELNIPTSSPTASPSATLVATPSAQPIQNNTNPRRNTSVGQKQSTKKNTRYSTSEVLVKFKENKLNLKNNSLVDKAKLSILSISNKLEATDTISKENVTVFKIKSKESVDEVINNLRKDDSVEIAQPNYIYQPSSIPTNDTYRSNLWGLDNTGQTVDGTAGSNDADVDAPEAWNYTQGSNAVVVAVIDTGVDYNHPDLAASMWNGTSCVNDSGMVLNNCNHGYDYENNDRTPLPDHDSHGTHVAGTIAAAKNNSRGIVGIAPDVKIMAIKTSFSSSELIKAVNFAKNNGAKVINASFGGYGNDTLLRSAISSFSGLFVAAAGNDTNNNDADPVFPCSFDLSNIICVSASTQIDNMAQFSNYGATTVDIAAPGENIYSTMANFTKSNFPEDFERVTPPAMPLGWTKTGYWGTYTAEPAWGNVLYSDVTNMPYLSNQSTYATSNTANLGGASAAKISMWTACDTEYSDPSSGSSDYVALEVSANGTTFTELIRWNEYVIDGDYDPNNGSAVYYIEDLNIPAQYLTSSYKLRFHWVTNGSNSGTAGDGCRIDDIRIDKYLYSSGESYGFEDGTSMATPHVTGTAALVWSFKPSLSANEVKSAILNNGDSIPSMSGKVTTGKRLNAFKALQSLAPVNTAPVANAQSVSAAEDVSTPITLSASDANNDTLTYSIVSNPSHGTLSSITNINQVSYTPAANYSGSDSFTFKANDGKVDSNVATVSITVTPVNDTPVLSPIGNKTVNEQSTLTFTATATDADGDALTYSLIGAPEGATINAGTGAFSFTPTEAQGPNSYPFNVQVTDGKTPVTQSVTITVYEVNTAPVAHDYSTQVEENANVTMRLSATDTDVPANVLYYNVVNPPTHGAVSSFNGNEITYTPAANFNGSDSFSYKVFDGTVESNVATVSITVNPVNYAPVLNFIPNRTINELQTMQFQASATDADGDTLQYTLSNAPQGMTVNSSTGLVTFTPTETQGPNTFNPIVTVSDGKETDSQVVTVAVNEVNAAPAVSDRSVTTTEDTPVQISVSATDNDVPEQTITFSSVSGASHGTLQYNAATGFTYTPSANYYGTDSFTYAASDGIAASNTATVTITISAVNDIPTANADSFTTAEDIFLSLHQSQLLANDTDVDGALFVTSVSNPSNGDIDFNAGYVTFSPSANFNGTAGYDYTVSDGSITSAAHVTITVTAVNDAPVAEPQVVSLFENKSKVVTLVASDIDTSTLSYAIASQPQHGLLSVVSGNTVTYTPAAGFVGSDSFSFTAFDGQVSSNTAVVSITVHETNDPPVLNLVSDQTVSELQTLSYTITATDPEGRELSYGLRNAPDGMSIVSSTGEISFTPSEAQGPDVFTVTYTVTDGLSEDTQDGLVTVSEVNQNPAAQQVNTVTNEDTGTEITLNGSDSDIPVQTLTYSIVSNPTHGSLTAIAGNKLTYTPDTNWNGTDSFTYRVFDGLAYSSNATVQVTVSAVNDVPVLTAIPSQTVDELTTLNFTISASDIDGDTLSYSLANGPEGMSTDPSSGQVTFTPTEAQGPNTYRVTVAASDGASSATQEVTVTVSEVNTAPVASNIDTATNEDGSVLITLSATDGDIPAQPIRYMIATAPLHGSLGTITGNTVVYTPNADFAGTDSFAFYANDGIVNSSSAAVTIAIYGVNDAPAAYADAVSTEEDTAIDIIASSLLSNDTDIDGDALSLIEVTNPVHGSVSLAANTVTFTPEANYAGQAQFSYKVSDGKATATGVVNVAVRAVNDAPAASDTNAETLEDTAVVIDLNASDIDSHSLSFYVTTNPVHGTLSALNGSTITYTPDSNYSGSDVFGFNVSDGSLLSNEAVVNVIIKPVNDAPVPAQDSFEIDEDSQLNIAKDNLLSNDSDPDSMSLYLTAVGNPSHGSVILGETGLEFTPETNYFGTAGFKYTVYDGQDSSTGHVLVTVRPTPDAPVAFDQEVSVTKNTDTAIILTGSDPDGDILTYTVVTEPGMGSISGLAPNLTYSPTLDYTGPDSLTFNVSDGTFESPEATITITVKNPEQKQGSDSSNSGVGGSSDNRSTASAPVCNEVKPDGRPTLYTPNDIDETTVILSWSPVNSATDYLVSYGTQPGIEEYGVSSVGGASVHSYTISHLRPGTRYYFRVKALKGCMPGDYSNEVNTTTWDSSFDHTSGNTIVLGTKTNDQTDASSSAELHGSSASSKTRKTSNLIFTMLLGLIGIPAVFAWRRRRR